MSLQEEEMARSHKDFTAALTSVWESLPADTDWEHDVDGTTLFFDHWFTKAVFALPGEWDKKMRFANALTEGMRTGGVSVVDAESMTILGFMLDTDLYLCPQMVEYYCRTGEIIELVGFFKYDGRFPPAYSFETSQRMLMAYRLYIQDVSTVKEQLSAGQSTREYMSLPLEIRMEFAGFWEPTTEGEEEDAMDFDYRDVLPDSVFESLQSQEVRA